MQQTINLLLTSREAQFFFVFFGKSHAMLDDPHDVILTINPALIPGFLMLPKP
jgi:hypothetical protein